MILILMFMRAVLVAMLAFALTACGAATPAPSDGRLRIVAAFYPLKYAAERVSGPLADVTSLTAPGAEPHDLELTPRQVMAIHDADLVIYLPGFQPAVDEAVAAEAGDRALDASAGLALLPATHGGGSDPHVWLDPMNMTHIAQAVTTRLSALRPSDIAQFTAHLTAATTDFTALDATWRERTTTCRSRDLVVSHEAFAYLAQRYRFTQVGISGLSPEAEPSAGTVAEVADFVRANDVRTIYYEALVDPKVAAVLASETGATTAVLDPIEGVAPGSDATYLTLMRANLDSVTQGQPCR